MTIPRDFLSGSFEFETEVMCVAPGKFRARAVGHEATASSPEQALNDLNAKLNVEMEKGTLVPNMGA